MIITSLQHNVVKDIVKTRKSKARLIVEGAKLIGEAYGSGLTSPLILVEEGREDGLKHLDFSADTLLVVSSRVMKKVSALPSPPGLLALFDRPAGGLETLAGDGRGGVVIVLDAIQDPGNVGLILRALRAFGGSGVISLPGTCRIWQEKVARASAGALFHVPFCEDVQRADIEAACPGAPLYVLTSRGGIDPEEVEWGERAIVIVGNEGHGPREDLRESAIPVTLPMPGGGESLNAAQAVTCFLYMIFCMR